MSHSDTRKFISILYVLTLLFIGAIYLQGDIAGDPEAVTTLQNIGAPSAGQHSAQLITGFQLSGETTIITVLSLTLFFGLVWLINQSKSY